MVLTKERAGILTEFLSGNTERASSLAKMTPSEALKQINAQGYDFTEAEIIEYGEAVSFIIEKNNGELDLDALDDVAGGSVTVVAAVVTAGAGVVRAISSIISSRW